MKEHIVECKDLPKGLKMKIGQNVYIGTGPELPPDNGLNLIVEEVTIQ